MSNEKAHLSLVRPNQDRLNDPFSGLSDDLKIQRAERQELEPRKSSPPSMIPTETPAKMPSMLAPRADEERKILDQGRLNIYQNMKMAAQVSGEAAKDFLAYELRLRKQEEQERHTREAEGVEQYRLQQEDERIRQAEMELKIRVAELQSRHSLEEQRIDNERIVAISKLAGQVSGLSGDLQHRLLALMPQPGATKRLTETED